MDVEELVAAAARTVRARRSPSAFLISTAPQWAIHGRALPDAPRPDVYQRHTLGRVDDVEVVIIKWGLRSTTPPHGHPDGGCWLAVLEGTLIEELPHLQRSDYVSIGYRRGADDIHIIRSVGDVPAMSVHIYDHKATKSEGMVASAITAATESQ